MANFRQGAGRLCLDFNRTHRRRGLPNESEELPDPAALASWLTQFVYAQEPSRLPTADEVAAAHELRSDIYLLIDAARIGDPLPTEPRRRVNAAAAEPVPAPALDPAGRLRLTADDPISAGLAVVARDAVDLIATGAARRVRRCAGQDCMGFFLDASRPGNRRWCSMDQCGSRAKKQTFREKH